MLITSGTIELTFIAFTNNEIRESHVDPIRCRRLLLTSTAWRRCCQAAQKDSDQGVKVGDLPKMVRDASAQGLGG